MTGLLGQGGVPLDLATLKAGLLNAFSLPADISLPAINHRKDRRRSGIALNSAVLLAVCLLRFS